MHPDEDEEKLLRSVALQNSQAVLLARERAERELRESNERISNILESISDAFIVLDREWRFIYINPQAEEIVRPLNKSRETLLGKNYWLEFPDLVGSPLDENFRRAVAENVKVYLEIFYPPLNSWFQVRAYPSQDGLSIYFLDITEQKQAAEALRESAERVHTMFNQAAVGIAMTSLEGRFAEANQKFCDILGYSIEELRKLTFFDVTYADDLDKAQANTGLLLAGKISEFAYEKRYICKDGSLVWSLTTVTTLKDAAGKPQSLVGVIEDISARKTAESVLRQSEERLRKTEKMAAAGQLAASLAHEINNPLSSVTNALYLLTRQPTLDDRARTLVSLAGTELARMSRIVKQSLAYYRQENTPRDIDIGAMVEESVQVYSDKLERGNIRVTKKIDAAKRIVGFADEVRQVIDNLLLNAVEAMASGGHLGVSVHPSLDWRDGIRKGVRLTIADSGCGIGSEILSRIFEPFFTTKAEKGTGLGLCVVHGLVVKHDGTIRVRSTNRDGRSGTVVSVLWPLTIRPYVQATRPTTPAIA